jgi:hypothetical protein
LLALDEPWSGLDVTAHGVLAGILTEVHPKALRRSVVDGFAARLVGQKGHAGRTRAESYLEAGRSMIALIRYTTATMLYSQRYLAPVMLFMAVVGISSRQFIAIRQD